MPDSFALHYIPESFSVAGQKLMGRQSAGVGLLQALARYDGWDAIGCFAAERSHAEAFEAALRADGYRGEIGWVPPSAPQRLERFGCLYHPGPGIERLAWRRLAAGEHRYSLCGITHATASHEMMSMVTDLLVAPVRSWDAIVCTSRVVRDSLRVLVEEQADYLRTRLAAQRFELPQLPLIPLGVHCADFTPDAGRREQARARMGIGADDVAFLYLGRLSVHAKSHPQQMFSALERADKGGRRVHLIIAGWYAGEAIEAAFREAAALLCPSVRLVELDGRLPDAQLDAWAAADVFTSLADNVQETFGLTPVEAMAAGLPCVVSDWNGYRDTVRDGVDGYRIPTVMPGPGAGLDLALRYDDGVDSFDMYCGHASQAVAVDGALLAQAYGQLVRDGSLRRRLGEQARRHAQAEYDWSAILARYRVLWDELAERRRADPKLAPPLPARAPDRPDPFKLFASYATRPLTAASLVELTPDSSLALVKQYRELAINRFAAASLPTMEDFGQLFGAIGPRPVEVEELIDTLGPCDRPTLLRGLAWLCKMDLLRVVE
ncbi:glycosyltransferase family 4 protein [Massilia sp. IC2-476]|uniref:glycosyltransferase family 4 protein n=1 Tax=Massilia sp. IC2-476 TaxID=2887199 RepID=UPI001D10F05D|nr:glycosyltransferase family 4 protein [Massilia sp. IC2-476]MCC2973135.1 glycosyltransferase family 4 protein [Massilia sp. IC2-476]